MYFTVSQTSQYFKNYYLNQAETLDMDGGMNNVKAYCSIDDVTSGKVEIINPII